MTRRSSMTISPITSSATLRVLENGALNTGNAVPARGVEVDLVGADAEAADRDQAVRGFENLRGDLRARADAEHMHALDGLLERIALERLGQARHVGIAGGLDQLRGAVVDAFEEQDPDLVLGERELGKFAGQDRGILQYRSIGNRRYRIVIAGAKRSDPYVACGEMDCFVASLLAQRKRLRNDERGPRQDSALSRKYGSTGPCTLMVSALP